MRVRLLLDGRMHEVVLRQAADGWVAEMGGETFPVHADHAGPGAVVAIQDTIHTVQLPAPDRARINGRDVPFQLLGLEGVAGAGTAAGGAAGPVLAPMTGRLEAVRVQEGDPVAAGDVLFVLEAMKMHNEVRAPAPGRVVAVHARAGDTVEAARAVLDLAPLE